MAMNQNEAKLRAALAIAKATGGPWAISDPEDGGDHRGPSRAFTDDNADFVALARNTLPALLAELDELRRDQDESVKSLERVRSLFVPPRDTIDTLEAAWHAHGVDAAATWLNTLLCDSDAAAKQRSIAMHCRGKNAAYDLLWDRTECWLAAEHLRWDNDERSAMEDDDLPPASPAARETIARIIADKIHEIGLRPDAPIVGYPYANLSPFAKLALGEVADAIVDGLGTHVRWNAPRGTATSPWPSSCPSCGRHCDRHTDTCPEIDDCGRCGHKRAHHDEHGCEDGPHGSCASGCVGFAPKESV